MLSCVTLIGHHTLIFWGQLRTTKNLHLQINAADFTTSLFTHLMNSECSAEVKRGLTGETSHSLAHLPVYKPNLHTLYIFCREI